MNTSNIKLVALALAFGFALAACDKPYSIEQAGREVDRVANQAGDELDEASKGLHEPTAITNEVLEDAAVASTTKTALMAESGSNVMDIECGYGGRRASPRWLCRFASQ